MNLSCILIPLLVGLISSLLGYMLGKMATTGRDNLTSLQSELDRYRLHTTKLETEINTLKAKLESGSHVLGFTPEPVVHVPFDASLATSVMERSFEENDLKIIEGIGPKIEELFKTSGIQSWKHLSETSVDRCNEILNKAGDQFAMHNPGTWPRQARLAYEGKWRDLKAWQDSMKGGIE